MSNKPEYIPFCTQKPKIKWQGPEQKLQIVLTNDDALKITLLLMSYRSLVASRERVSADIYLQELFVIKDGIDAMFDAAKDAKQAGSAL